MRNRGLILGVIGGLMVIAAGCLVCLVASLVRPATPSPTSTRVLARTPTSLPTLPPLATQPPATQPPARFATLPPLATAASIATRPPPTVPPVLPTRAPTQAPVVIPTKAQPLPTLPVSAPAACTCQSDTLNCGDFRSFAEAQACYIKCGGKANDIYGLDRNNDGTACESYQY